MAYIGKRKMWEVMKKEVRYFGHAPIPRCYQCTYEKSNGREALSYIYTDYLFELISIYSGSSLFIILYKNGVKIRDYKIIKVGSEHISCI